MERTITNCSTRPQNLHKENIKASAAELLYGTPLRVPIEYFAKENMPADTQIFAEKFREHMRELRRTPLAHHIRPSMFSLKDLYTYLHVFLRTNVVKSPLQPRRTGLYKVVKRLSNFLFVIKVEDKGETETGLHCQRGPVRANLQGRFLGKRNLFPSLKIIVTVSLGREWMWPFRLYLLHRLQDSV
jgi:hypothetical protein